MNRLQTITLRIEVRGEFDAEATYGQLTTVLDLYKDDTEREFKGTEVTISHVVTEVTP